MWLISSDKLELIHNVQNLQCSIFLFELTNYSWPVLIRGPLGKIIYPQVGYWPISLLIKSQWVTLLALNWRESLELDTTLGLLWQYCPREIFGYYRFRSCVMIITVFSNKKYLSYIAPYFVLIKPVGNLFDGHTATAIRAGLILGLRPANDIGRYFVTTSLIGWAQT